MNAAAYFEVTSIVSFSFMCLVIFLRSQIHFKRLRKEYSPLCKTAYHLWMGM